MGNRAAGKSWNVGRASSTGNRFEILQYTDNNAYFVAEQSGSQYGYCAAAAGDFSAALVFDGTQAAEAAGLAGYLNGARQSLTFTGTWFPGGPLSTSADPTRIGYDVSSAAYSDGRYDLALLWCGRALSAADVAALHRDPWQLFAPGPPGSRAWPAPPVVVAGARVQGRRPVFLFAPRPSAVVGRRTLTPRVGSRGPA